MGVIFFVSCILYFVSVCVFTIYFFEQEGVTPLMAAACRGCSDVLSVLLTSGAAVEAHDEVHPSLPFIIIIIFYC